MDVVRLGCTGQGPGSGGLEEILVEMTGLMWGTMSAGNEWAD